MIDLLGVEDNLLRIRSYLYLHSIYKELLAGLVDLCK